VSLSTLLVSFSFAMGKSVSTWIEGLLLIAVQRCVVCGSTCPSVFRFSHVGSALTTVRPFGLGDRIIMIGVTSNDNPGVAQSWFVEGEFVV
jgi:hypothetical protein